MSLQSYSYKKLVHTFKLSIEISNSDIETDFSHMTTTDTPEDEVTIYFTESLNESEKNILDTLILEHDHIEGVEELTKNINRVSYSLINSSTGSLIDLLSYKVIAVLPWNINRAARYINGVVSLEVTGITTSSIDIRVIDSTNAKNLGQLNINTNGFYELEIDNPISSAGLELQSRTLDLLSTPIIKGAIIEFDVE